MDIQMQTFQMCAKSFPKSVTGSADRLDAYAGRAKFATYLQDVLIKGSARGEVVLSPYGIEERVSGKDLSRMRSEGLEESEFPDGQRLFRFVWHAHEKAIRIYERIAYAERAVSVGWARRGIGPAECRCDTGKEFSYSKRLGNEIVRAEPKPDYAVCIRGLLGQE